MTRPAQRYAFAKERFNRARRILESRSRAPARQFAQAAVTLGLLDPRDMPADVYEVYKRVMMLLDRRIALSDCGVEKYRLQRAFALLRDATQRLDERASA